VDKEPSRRPANGIYVRRRGGLSDIFFQLRPVKEDRRSPLMMARQQAKNPHPPVPTTFHEIDEKNTFRACHERAWQDTIACIIEIQPRLEGHLPRAKPPTNYELWPTQRSQLKRHCAAASDEQIRLLLRAYASTAILRPTLRAQTKARYRGGSVRKPQQA